MNDLSGSPMEVAEAVVFVLKELKVVQYGGFTLLITFGLRYGATPFITALGSLQWSLKSKKD